MGKRILKSQIEGETYHGKGGAVIRLYRGQIRVWYPSKKEAWEAAKKYNSMGLDLIDGKQIAEVLRNMEGQQSWEWCHYDASKNDWDFFPTLESLIEYLKTEENSTLFERLTLNKKTDSEIVLKLRGVNDLLDEFELTVDGLPQQSEHDQYKIPKRLIDQVRRALNIGGE